MKKKITQWFVGLLFSTIGFCTIMIGIQVVTNFIDMMNNTGKEFIVYFIGFVVFLVMFLCLPYIIFHTILKNGVRDEYK